MDFESTHCLVLRLAGPLQSWGSQSQFNRRETSSQPTRSGVLGLLAAAQGRRREDSITDLLALRMGVRVDQAGSLLRDYHTVSDYRGEPLLSASVTGKGLQKRTSPAKYTHVTERFYLQDAAFVVAVTGPRPLLETLAEAVMQPGFPLALGRRSCVPAQPMVVSPTRGTDSAPLWEGDIETVLVAVPWMASDAAKAAYERRFRTVPSIDLAVTVDDDNGPERRSDVPVSFEQSKRAFITRRVRHGWVTVPTGFEGATEASGPEGHDPFALLGW